MSDNKALTAEAAKSSYAVAQLPNAFDDVAVTAVSAQIDLGALGLGGKWISFQALTANVTLLSGTHTLVAGAGFVAEAGILSKEYFVDVAGESLAVIAAGNCTLRIFSR